jgi:hypothetical protein
VNFIVPFDPKLNPRRKCARTRDFEWGREMVDNQLQGSLRAGNAVEQAHAGMKHASTQPRPRPSVEIFPCIDGFVPHGLREPRRRRPAQGVQRPHSANAVARPERQEYIYRAQFRPRQEDTP